MPNTFHPSAIANKIYEILEDYEVSLDTYKEGVIDAIEDYLENYLHINYNLMRSDWPNEEGGVCGVTFIDGGYLQLVMFDYIY